MTASNVLAIAPATRAPMVSKARKGLVSFLKTKDAKVGEFLKGYADALCAAFNTEHTPWYELKGKLGKEVKAERVEFVAEMKAAGYEQGTIDVYWGRVKDASGRVKAPVGKVVAPKDIDTEVLKGIATILNKIYAAEDADATIKASNVKKYLLDAFTAMGGDVMELG